MKTDPTRSRVLRMEFVRELERKFKALRRKILEYNFVPIVTNAPSGKTQLQSFEAWIQKEYKDINPNAGVWEQYVEKAYARGNGRMYSQAKSQQMLLDEAGTKGGQKQFLSTQLAKPESINKVKMLAQRVHTDLKGVTSAMSTQMSRTLTDGFARGDNAKIIGKNMAADLDKIGLNRARAIARTEVTRAHAEGQLDALEAMGGSKVGFLAEWSTAGDSRVCELCAPLEGTIMSIREARGTIPRHTNCRCAYLPINDEFMPKGVKTSKADREKAIKASLKAELGKKSKSLAADSKISTWKGASVKGSVLKKKKAVPPPKAPKDTKTPKKSTPKPDPKPIPKVKVPKKAKAPKPKKNPVTPELTAEQLRLKELNEKGFAAVGETVSAVDQTLIQKYDDLVSYAEETLVDYSKIKFQSGVKVKPEIMDDIVKKFDIGKYKTPRAIKIGDQYILIDGEHLAANRWLSGAKNAYIDVIDFDKVKAQALKEGFTPNLLARSKVVKKLPGSTSPKLIVDPATDLKWVIKEGLDPGHVRSEALADELYRQVGLKVPNSAIIETAEGPVKISQYLDDGKTLSDWMRGKSIAEKQVMFKQIQEGFVMDSLIANHDVVGLSLDNIFIVDDIAYRIDNGGALLYRAQGAPKRGFGAAVDELVSLRNPGINSQTAEVFGSISDDQILAQIRDIQKKSKKILDAVSDPALRKTLQDRIKWLESRLPPKKKAARAAKIPKRLKSEGAADYAVNKELLDNVKKSRMNGRTLAADKDLIEDNNILIWHEVGSDGSIVTRATFKVTEEGAKTVASRISAPPTTYVDVFHDRINSVAKSINKVNSEGGSYFTLQKSAIKDMKEALRIISQQSDPDGSIKSLVKHYSSQLKVLEDSIASKKMGMVPSMPKFSPKGINPGLEVEKIDGVKSRINQFEKGYGKQAIGENSFRGQALKIKGISDDVEISYVPPKVIGSRQSRDALSLENMVDITVKGDDINALNNLKSAVDQLGIDVTPSAAYEEAVYIHRTIYLRKDHNTTAYKNIWADKSLTDEARVKKLKEWVNTKYGIDLDNTPHYQPAGESLSSFGNGHRYWKRWDISDKEVESKMKGLSLIHTVGGDLSDSKRGKISKALDGMFSSGGEATSTNGRFRKGVNIGNVGASSSTDVRTGGADYFFTRVKKSDAKNRGVYFKIRNVRRADTVSYMSDEFGSIAMTDFRMSTLEELKSVVPRTSNETIFKHGLSLADEIDVIKVHDAAEKADVLKVLSKHKMDVFPDGRRAEDVVQISSGSAW